MSVQEEKYDAFISYRHTELDMFVAENLHKELESFRLPKNLVKKLKKNGVEKTRIKRVFRDKDELPIASDLSNPIMQAIHNSEFLIIICTPRLLLSKWCSLEIETFIKIHGRERVLAVLAEGEPNDSFPDSLKFIQIEEVQLDGSVKMVRAEIEPLAADVRGRNKRAIKKLIKEEVVRLAAPIFSCGYDELKQRHRERKLKRIIMGSLVGGSISLVFALISTTMALQIKAQANTIETQYEQVLIEQGKSTAKDAIELLDSGDRYEALEILKKSMPTNLEEPEVPYTAQGEYALSEVLYTYRNGEQILPVHLLEGQAFIEILKISPKGKYVLSVDAFRNLKIWEPLERNIIDTIELEGSTFDIMEDHIEFLSETEIIIPKKEGFTIYDFVKKKNVFEDTNGSYNSVNISEKGKYLAVVHWEGIYVYDTETFEIIYQYDSEYDKKVQGKILLSEKENLLIFPVTTSSGESEATEILITNLQDKSIINNIKMKDEDIDDMLLSNDNLFVASYEDFGGNGKKISELEGRIQSFDMTNGGTQNWDYPLNNSRVEEIQLVGGAEEEILSFITYNSVGFIQKETGIETGEIDFGEEIIHCFFGDNKKIGTAIMRDGSYIGFDVRNAMSFNMDYKFKPTSTTIIDYKNGENYAITLDNKNTNITVYEMKRGSQLQDIYHGDEVINQVAISPNEEQIAFVEGSDESSQLLIFDLVTDQIINTIPIGKTVFDIKYLDRNTVGVLSTELIAVDIETGSKKPKLAEEMEESIFINQNYFLNDNIIITDYEGVGIFDVSTGKLNAEIKQKIDLDDNQVFGISNQLGIYAMISKKDKTLFIAKIEDNTKLVAKTIDAAYIKYLNFDEKEELLYVTYIDCKVDVLDVNTLEVVGSYDELLGLVEVVERNNNSGSVILYTKEEGYILNEKKEIIARVDDMIGILEKSNQYLLKNGKDLFTVPIYSYNMLIEEAHSYSN